MQRPLLFAASLIVVVLTTGVAQADEPTAEPPRPARFQAWLPFLRLDRPPAPLRLSTEAHLGGAGSGVALDGDRAYQVQGGRLLVWDLADPDTAQVIGRLDLPLADAPGTVTISGGVLVVLQAKACGPSPSIDPPAAEAKSCGHAAIIDTRDGHAPVLLSDLAISGRQALMSRWGERLYVAVLQDAPGSPDASELQAYDLRVPEAPVLISRLVGLPVLDQLVAGQDLIAASTYPEGGTRLLLFEARKGRLTLKQSEPIEDRRCSKLLTVGDRLWMLFANGGVRSWRWRSGTRLDRPLSAVLPLDTLVVDQAVALDGQFCTFDSVYESIKLGIDSPLNTLTCFDITDPSSPQKTLSYRVAADEPVGLPAAHDDRLLLSEPNRGAMILVDLLRPHADRQRLLDSGAGSIAAFVIKGDWLFSWEYPGAIRRWDLRLPIRSTTQSVGYLPFGVPISNDLDGHGPAGRWIIEGGLGGSRHDRHLFFGAVDFSDPLDPKRRPGLGIRLSDLNIGTTFAASGDLAWYRESIYRDPPHPLRAFRVDERGFTEVALPWLIDPSAMLIWRDTFPVMVTPSEEGGSTLTVIDDDYRTVLSRLEGLERASSAIIVGSEALVASGQSNRRESARLAIVELADLKHPRQVDSVDLPMIGVQNLYRSGSRLLVTGWALSRGGPPAVSEPAVCILGIEDPTQPETEGCAQPAAMPAGPLRWVLSPDGERLYIADNGLTVLRLDLPGTVPNIRTQPPILSEPATIPVINNHRD